MDHFQWLPVAHSERAGALWQQQRVFVVVDFFYLLNLGIQEKGLINIRIWYVCVRASAGISAAARYARYNLRWLRLAQPFISVYR